MKKTRLKRMILTVLLGIGVLTAFVVFIHDNSERIERQNEEYLNELTSQRAISVDNLILENLSFIKSTSYLYGKNLTSRFADVAAIRNYEESSVFDMLRFIDASGDNYTSKGVQANLSDREYFQAGMRGESGITYVSKSRVTGEKQIGFYAPVEYENEVIGVMVGFYGEAYIERLLDYELFGYEGEGWLCNQEGEILGATSKIEYDNYFTYLEETGRCDAENIRLLKDIFAEGKETAFTYQEDGIKATGYAVPLSGIQWMLIRSFPPSASQGILHKANGEGIKLILALLAMFAVYGIILAIDFVFENRRIRAAGRDANEVSTGVSRLFESFVGVDLETGQYRYLQGRLAEESMPREGSYQDLIDLILEHSPIEKEKAAAGAFLALDNLKEILKTNDKISFRIHSHIADAEWLTYNFIVTERENGEAKRMVIGGQDVTMMHYHEEQEQKRLQQALDKAEKASKAKTEFLFNMSHDLRTPMNAIIGYTELAGRDGVNEEEMREYFKKIDSSSKHLLALINDILEMSRVESGKLILEPAAMNINQVMEETEELFATQMKEKKIDFTVQTEDIRNDWVLCDKNRLNRVILNLISNAYKFTPEGGTISVLLKEKKAEENQAAFVLSVKDSGIGMSEEFVKKLFTPFERERTSTLSGIQGTGLGLSITKNIIDQMGGTIDVKTKQGAGTEFVVSLCFPITEAPVPEISETEKQEENTDFNNARLLLVEDNEVNREIALMILTQEGFTVETAENGQIAVDKIAGAEEGYYDLVLMDVQMPVMDGYTATRRIRGMQKEKLAGIPILAMTANAFQEDVQAAIDAGMDGHIAKPLDVSKMMAEIRRALR